MLSDPKKPEDLDVILLDETRHCLKGDYFQKIEPLIDDAIRDCHAAVAPSADTETFIREMTVFNNLVCDLFRHAEPPTTDDPQLSFRMIEGVILGLKGHPIPTLTGKEWATQPVLGVNSALRVISILVASNRRQIRASLRRLLETTRHAPIADT
jgi:hypothetical protein